MKVLLGMPSYSGVFPSVIVQSIFNLIKPCPVGFMTVDRLPIVQARNIIADTAIKKDYDYLFFVDDDNPIPRDTLVKFIEDDKDMVGAPILHRNPDASGNRALCVFYQYVMNGMRLYKPIPSFPEGYLHKIDACGMGCTLIKRKVLEGVDKNYPGRPFQLGNLVSYNEGDKIIDVSKGLKRTMSEDIEFSERACDAGFEIWTDLRIRPLHLTRMGAVQWHQNNHNINTSEYWDSVWCREGEYTWRKYPLAFQKIVQHVAESESVLDVGCGVGVLLEMLKPRDIAGLDISPRAIEILKQKGIPGMVGTLPKIDLPDKCVDVVIASETIEHLDEPGGLIKEMTRIARKKIILTTPDNCLGPETEKEHRQKFTEEGLRLLLDPYFTQVSIERFTDTFPTATNTISLPTLLVVCDMKDRKEKVACNPDMMGIKVG